MKNRLGYGVAALFAIVIIVVSWWYFCAAPVTVMLIRHADRAGTQDALSPAGVTRSQQLVHVMQKAALAAIIRSDTVRAEQTAAPLAAATGITPIVIPATNVMAVVDEIRGRHRGQKILVVGHSNTVPQIIAALGGPALPDIAENEFDNLFMLELCGCRIPAFANLQYGVPSP